MQAEMDPVGKAVALDEVVVWALAVRAAAATTISGLKIMTGLVASPIVLSVTGAAYMYYYVGWKGKVLLAVTSADHDYLRHAPRSK